MLKRRLIYVLLLVLLIIAAWPLVASADPGAHEGRLLAIVPRIEHYHLGCMAVFSSANGPDRWQHSAQWHTISGPAGNDYCQVRNLGRAVTYYVQLDTVISVRFK